ncbi:putative RDD family membrane protein YckC [Aminobacter lissarensis]|uniref:RDD family membrane protein YckC n=1 Tax=Aminobacter carboxidus TaxID=376165 RepID=A0A8E1WCC2_9HYPH|nr:RDD family protein [Aminobacter lissarensis]MBB6465373.1 putative RDD family membrane protein YckC [Aminobacter lissarensis]
MTDVESAPVRAGFWRRVGALVIDCLVVLVPLQIVVVVLFAMSNGSIQGSFGFVSRVCQTVAQAPSGLEPPPPADANTFTECEIGFFGLPTARTLAIGTVKQEGNTTSGRFITYALDAQGNPVNAFTTDWIAILAVAVYLIAMERRSGATIGKRTLGIRAVPTNTPGQIGLPLRQAVIRQAAKWIGMIPAMLFAVVVFFVLEDPFAAMETQGYWTMFAIAAAIQIAWLLWIIISVSTKRDPIYDRIAGTSVLRTG